MKKETICYDVLFIKQKQQHTIWSWEAFTFSLWNFKPFSRRTWYTKLEILVKLYDEQCPPHFFFLDIRSCYVSQAGLKLLGESGRLISASWIAATTCMCHGARQCFESKCSSEFYIALTWSLRRMITFRWNQVPWLIFYYHFGVIFLHVQTLHGQFNYYSRSL